MRVLPFATVAVTLLAPFGVSALLALEKRSFQTSATCLSNYSWMDNSNDASPCSLAAVVLGSCEGNEYLVPRLNSSDQEYTPPNSTTTDVCSCSWAAYNLLSACTMCQGFLGSVLGWPAYNPNCTTNYLSPSYFPSQQVVPDGTLLPWYAATDPTTWKNEEFNFDDAYAKASQGHADVTLGATSTPQKKSTPVGPIVGGVVGGLAALTILGLVLFMYRRRRAGRLDRPLQPTQFGAGHMKSLSDSSHMTSGTTLGYQAMNGSFVTPTLTVPRSITYARSESENSHSYFGSVAHSADLLYSSASSRPGGTVPPPPADIQHRDPQDIIVPFVFLPDQQGSNHRQGDQKRSDGAIIPVYDHPNSMPVFTPHISSASTSNDNHPRSRRVSPPAYTAEPGPADVMSTGSGARTRPTHTKKGSTGTSADSTQSGSPTTTAPGAHGIPGLEDVVEEMRFDRPETMSGTGGTLATGMSTQLPGNRVFRPFVENPDASII